MKIDPAWLEDGKDMALCPVCLMVLDQPTVGCPEGHALCRQCYVTELSRRKKCPLCQHPTDASRLQRCRPFEDILAEMRVRCKHGPEGEGGEQDTNMELLHCSWRGKVCELEGHLAHSCAYELMQCPCPGCEERMVRAKVEEHVAASGAVHLQRAWKQAEELEEENKELQKNLPGRADALTRVFTWSTDSAWVEHPQRHLSFIKTFTDGVRGPGSTGEPADESFTHWMGFALEEGPPCTMHYKCSILDKNDKVIRVVSAPEDADFQQPPIATSMEGDGWGVGASFNLTAAEKAGAVRADGSIKLRMVLHLYLP